MKITDLLKPEGIKLGGSAKDKADTIRQMVDLMCREGNIKDKAKYKAAVEAREQESTTAVGDGIAIPHGRIPVRRVSQPEEPDPSAASGRGLAVLLHAQRNRAYRSARLPEDGSDVCLQ